MGLGLGMGTNVAGGTVGAAGGLIDVGQTALGGIGAIQFGTGIASMLGLMKAPLLSTGVMGAMTGASLGGAGGMALSMLGGPAGLALMAGSAGVNIAQQGMRNANQVSSLFGNMQFASGTGDPRTGRGFSQQDLATLQRGITNISANNPFISMSDAMRTADRFTDSGMHQGIQDAEKLSKKIVQMGKTLHEMARHLGTSMEEAGSIFKEMKNAGYYSAQDVMGNVQNMTLMRGYGMSSERFSQMQMTGAGMTRSAQMSGRAGAGMMTSKTADFMSLIRSGQMTGNEMMDITGASDPLEAAQIMAQQTLSGTMQGLQGGLGTAMLLAMGRTDKSGKFTGEVDANVLSRMSSGELTRSEMLEIGAQKRGTRQGQVSFMAKKQDISETLLESEQAQEALFGMVKSLAKQLGGEGAGEDEDFLQLVAETQMSIDRRTFRALQKLSDSRKRRTTDALRELRTNERAAQIKEDRTLGGLVTKIEGTFNDAVMTPMAAVASEGYREVLGAFGDLEKRILGGNDITMQASSKRLNELLVEGTGAGAVNLTLGDSARAAALQGNLGLFDAGVGAVDSSQAERQLKSAFNQQPLENYLQGIKEGVVGGRLFGKGDTSLTRDQLQQIATKAGIQFSGSQEDQEKLLAAIAKQGGETGRLMAAEAAMSLGSGGGNMNDVSALQDEMSAALRGAGTSMFSLDEEQSSLAKFQMYLPGGQLPGLLAMSVSSLFDSDAEEAREALSMGGDSTELLSLYAANQREIDTELSGLQKDEDFSRAATALSKKFGLKLTAADVKHLEAALRGKTGKSGSERAQGGVDEKTKQAISGAAKKLVDLTAKEKIVEAQRGLVQASGRQYTGDAEKQLQAAIKDAASSNLSASTTDSAELRTLAYGGDTFKKLQQAGSDGLTRAELREILPFDEGVIDQLLAQGGATMESGKITAPDQEALSSFLAAKAATGISTSEQAETFLNAGMSPMERQSLSVQKTAELVDKLYREYYKTAPGVTTPEGGGG
jgi:hypothetical protein